MNLVLMGVEGFDGIALTKIEDKDFAARGADGERNAIRHEIQRRQTMIRRNGFQSLTLAGVVADNVVVQASA